MQISLVNYSEVKMRNRKRTNMIYRLVWVDKMQKEEKNSLGLYESHSK